MTDFDRCDNTRKMLILKSGCYVNIFIYMFEFFINIKIKLVGSFSLNQVSIVSICFCGICQNGYFFKI